ncbi:Germination, Ger(X)C family protein [Candidatus Desulfosporosinus infrequens]|uniref:Germination, Ger(X)C family protein n=1 Tax=Candidatus Desulfosporosinus infrequens TaxID=2043169 RepID=A0A2U3JWH4_9FIRM|nr:Germination, Ger(X)C family protein [Candidatus Desulfosporosinus infrequens]
MKRKRRKTVLVLILIACSLFLTGCWGTREVEELEPLIGLGFDLGQKPGTYLITEQFAKPTKGETSTSAEIHRTFSIEASSLREAYEKTSKIISHVPFMGSLKVIVIGEDVAKVGFLDVADFLQRYSEFRRSMYLVLAKGKAQSILNVKMRTGTIVAMYIKDNIETGKTISTYPTVRLGHYLTVLGRKSTAPIMPVIEMVKSGDEGIEYETDGKEEAQELRIQGAGVFRGDQLIDFLNDEETKGYMWLENQVLQRPMSTVGTRKGEPNFTGQVLNSKTRYKVSDKDGTIGLQYQIKASIEIDEVQGLKEQLSETEWVDLMKGAEKSFAKVIQKECELSIQKERRLGLDFLGIGRHIEERNSAYWKTVKDQWEQKIADFPVSVNVEVTIHHSGMSNSSATVN